MLLALILNSTPPSTIANIPPAKAAYNWTAPIATANFSNILGATPKFNQTISLVAANDKNINLPTDAITRLTILAILSLTLTTLLSLHKLNNTTKTKLPTHIEIRENTSGLKNNSVVLVEQIRTIDKSRLKEKIGHIDDNQIISRLNNALGVSFGLD